ncbi:intercellular adhesion molecule 1-like isoform X2 [Varanus komodoensis]|uniref:intercellular adhesion molecule 1-like isoform X2 n=1 Tax=Varanus komodoensis TaxID=61221 RepID=UPI001CF7C10F|nr:intercellular adhesion molecule 1-like isoform X2 [Varanus komodoensis]
MTAVLLLTVAALSSWAPVVHPCKVTIHPQELAVEFGGPVILNCTSSCANHDKMDWEVSLQGLKEEGKGWISLNVASVTEWNFQPLCLVKNAGPETLKKARVYVYRFSTPAIHVPSEIVDGRHERILCNISSLKVRDNISSNINITLSRGGDILNSSYSSQLVEYNFVPSLQQDDGAEILCVANVQVGSEVLEKSTNTTLGIVENSHYWIVALVVLVPLLVAVIFGGVYLFLCRK